MKLVAYVSRFFLGIAALALIGLSGFQGAFYWWREMHANQLLLIGMLILSVSASAVKVLVPVLLSIYRERFFDNRALALGFMAALIFDLWSGLGYNELRRAAALADHNAANRAWTEIRDEIGRKEAKLAELQSTRPLKRLEAEETEKGAVAGKCKTPVEARTDACQAWFKVKSELGEAQTREALEKELTDLRTKQGKLPEVPEAEPYIATMSKSLNVGQDKVRWVWVGLVLLMLEVLPTTLLAKAAQPLPAPAPRLPTPKGEAPAGGGTRRPPAGGGPRAPQKTRDGKEVLSLLQVAQTGADGWISTTQRAIADQLSMSATEVNRQLAELESSGILAKQAGRSGTKLKLLSQPTSVVRLHTTG